MNALRRHKKEIKEIKFQIQQTNSPYRKRDLKKQLARLRQELKEYLELKGYVRYGQH